MDYVFNFQSLTPYLGGLYPAVVMTLAISLSSMVISLVLGLIVALGRTSRSRITRWAATAYVEFFRNTPLLIILYLVYFAVPEIGLRLSPFQSALLGMSLHFAAYMAEILRAGLLAVPSGQYEAAQAQGMEVLQLLRHVVLPQVLQTIYAPLGNQFIVIVLGSSLCSAIAVNDIGSWMQTTGATSFRYFETFLVAGIVYAVLCQTLNLLRLRLGRMLFTAR
jgi:His/Glu/Gln/Arg/opine family amino acid ABC transporter permease subunit